ncbi:hypothetical protein [Thalassobacillus pellis]|uniref:hypothetical protein n=1 Tax=Thalassobacillus pellis TaxID=748008 RepID=UPI001960461D|nr:hypothetical protein [Thalassobacillus pellis]MBM7551232.1 hypothetical protein [Thalassobacillus pellis]
MLEKIIEFFKTGRFSSQDGSDLDNQSITGAEHNSQIMRNIKAVEFENEGNIEAAKQLYLKNVDEGFVGVFPYERLSAIYREEESYDKEIDVIHKALEVLADEGSSGRSSKHPSLVRLQERLESIRQLKAN